MYYFCIALRGFIKAKEGRPFSSLSSGGQQRAAAVLSAGLGGEGRRGLAARGLWSVWCQGGGGSGDGGAGPAVRFTTGRKALWLEERGG